MLCESSFECAVNLSCGAGSSTRTMSLGCYNTAHEAASVLVMRYTEIQSAAAEAEEEEQEQEAVVEADQENSIQLVCCFLLERVRLCHRL